MKKKDVLFLTAVVSVMAAVLCIIFISDPFWSLIACVFGCAGLFGSVFLMEVDRLKKEIEELEE